MSDLGFFAADTLGVALYQVKGQLVAHELHTIPWGPWRVELPIHVESDIISGVELGFFVKAGPLSFYMVVKEKESWLLLLEGSKPTIGTAVTLKGRMGELTPMIRGIFRWNGAEWKRVEYDGAANAHHLVQKSTS